MIPGSKITISDSPWEWLRYTHRAQLCLVDVCAVGKVPHSLGSAAAHIQERPKIRGATRLLTRGREVWGRSAGQKPLVWIYHIIKQKRTMPGLSLHPTHFCACLDARASVYLFLPSSILVPLYLSANASLPIPPSPISLCLSAVQQVVMSLYLVPSLCRLCPTLCH